MVSREEEREQELDEAIANMETALDSANGTCAKKIRGRTTATRRALRSLLESTDHEQC